MQIKANTVVSLNYAMYDQDNNLIDQNVQPIVYLHGGYDNILPAVEAALEGKQAGDKSSVMLQPEQAFGERDPNNQHEEDISAFPPDIEVGMMFETQDADSGELLQFKVVNIDAGVVTLDGNHPLAGMVIRFDTEVLAVRAASDEEVAHGHVHDGSHEHH